MEHLITPNSQINLNSRYYGNAKGYLFLSFPSSFFTMIFSLYIINKAGGLVYQKDFTQQLEKLSSNEYLVLAGTFHG